MNSQILLFCSRATKNRVDAQDQSESHVWKVVAVVLWGPLMTQLTPQW
jgi:hypothetical protein